MTFKDQNVQVAAGLKKDFKTLGECTLRLGRVRTELCYPQIENISIGNIVMPPLTFVKICLSEDLEWNYPYYNLNKFLSYLAPHIWERGQHFSSDGSYLFRYDSGLIQQSFRGETRDSKGVIQGYYGYVDPNGVLRITEYISDNLGYRSKTTLRYQIP